MAEIAYLLLCHRNPQGVIAQARRLTAAGDRIAIHFDGRAPDADFASIRTALAGDPRVTFASRRIRCGWGEWSLVEATLEAARAAISAFPQATHFYLLSGDCMAIKTAEHTHAMLEAEPADYIESVDFHTSGWIRTGMREERLIYRHPFNERRNKRLFYASMEVQKRLRLRRAPPEGLKIMIGSQWWCLRRATLEAVLEFCAQRPDVIRFFRTTWIPDETFFQSLVRHLVPQSEIRSRTLTFLMFTDYGMPVTFCDDHYDMLLDQDYLFARKISPGAAALQERLGDLYASGRRDSPPSSDGRALYRFLAGRGRAGRRYASRIWETGANLARDHRLTLITCKDWDQGRRISARIAEVTGIASFGYIFNHMDDRLPDLGGVENAIDKRRRHRRALVRMLFDVLETDRLVFCVDPGDFDVIEDMMTTRARSALVQVDHDHDESFLAAHAANLGLAAPGTRARHLRRLLPTLQLDIRLQNERIREATFENSHIVRPGAPTRDNAAALAAALQIGLAAADAIAEPEGLFTTTEEHHALHLRSR